MPLKTLSVTNWKNQDQKTIEFKEGINLIYGKNHAGKTSLLQGIYFALTGDSTIPIKTGVTQASKVLQFMRRIGTKSTLVNLDCERESQEGEGKKVFRLKRSLEGARNSSESIFEVDEQGNDTVEIAAGNEVGQEIREFLGCGPEFVKNALFLHEGEIFDFILKPGDAFLKELDKFQGTDQFLSLGRNLDDLRKNGQKSLKDREADIKRLEDRLKHVQPAKDPAEIETEIGQIEQEITSIKQKISALETKQAAVKGTWTPTQETRDQVQKNITTLKVLVGILKDRRDLEGKTLQLTGEFELPANQDLSALIETIEEKITSIKASIKENQKEERDAIAEQGKLGGLITAEEDKLEKIEIAGDQCPLCEQTLSAEHKNRLVKVISGRLETYGVQVKALDHEKERSAAARKNLNRDLKSCNRQLDQVQDLKHSFDRLASDFKKNMKKMDGSGLELTVEFSAALYGDFQTILEDEEHRFTLLTERIKKKQDEYDEYTNQIRATESELEQKRLKVAILKAQKKAGSGTVDMKALLEEYQAERDYLVHQKSLIKVFAEALDLSLKEYRQVSMQKIKNNVRDLWKKFHEGTYNVTWTDKFFPVIEKGGDSLETVQLSEAERLEVFLGLRIALTNAYGNVDFLILDEPFHHLDEDNKKVLFQYLQWILEHTKIKQVIVTSFEKVVKDAWEWDKIIEL